jgi:hypothetical protein
MKTKLTRQFSGLIALLAFLALMSGNAFAACTKLHVTNTTGPFDCVENGSVVLSPYWQSDSGSYTFIAVSHTSLSGMASQIGVTVRALASDINDNTLASNVEKFSNAVTFTVTSGTTKRVFIVRSGHATINPTSITDAAFITGTTNFTHGSIRVDQVSTHPETPTSVMTCSSETARWAYNQNKGLGAAQICSGAFSGATVGGPGYTDATMLSYWGSVVVEKNTTGFAMEFLGDMNDSQGGHTVIDGPVAGPAAP